MFVDNQQFTTTLFLSLNLSPSLRCFFGVYEVGNLTYEKKKKSSFLWGRFRGFLSFAPLGRPYLPPYLKVGRILSRKRISSEIGMYCFHPSRISSIRLDACCRWSVYRKIVWYEHPRKSAASRLVEKHSWPFTVTIISKSLIFWVIRKSMGNAFSFQARFSLCIQAY